MLPVDKVLELANQGGVIGLPASITWTQLSKIVNAAYQQGRKDEREGVK